MKIREFIVSLSIVFAAASSCRAECPAGSPSPEEPHTVMVSFDKSGSRETFHVAVRDKLSKSKWFVFSLNHYLDHGEEPYMDLWRIDGAYLALYKDGAFTVLVERLLTNGENESVFRDCSDESTMADFTGGFHGDERIDLEKGCGAVFYIDGEALGPERLGESFGWTECDRFHYVQTSSMHKTGMKADGIFTASDHRTVAVHVKTTVFADSGYNTVNRLEFREALPVYWYCGICCVGHNLADKGCNEDFIVETFDSSGGNRLDGTGKNEFHAWHDGNGVEVNITGRMLSGGDDSQCRMFIWDTANYAKYYRRIPAHGSMQTSPGMVLESEMNVTLNVR